MKAIFATASVSAIVSLLGLMGVSAMSIVPSPGAEDWRRTMMITVATVMVGWLGLAGWAWGQMRRSKDD